MMNIFTLLTLLLVWGKVQSQQLFTLVKHSQTRGGACLDGSPPGLYYQEGKGSNKNKFMMYFDSGGYCGAGTLSQTLQSCYKRSFSSLGSTTGYPEKKAFDNFGLLSPIKQNNPVFYDWTRIFVIYCDGSQYQGSRSYPIQYKDRQLFFRGYNNTVEQFRFMDQKFDFYNGHTIVMTGVSAGGLATYQWSNYLFQRTKKAKVYSIPDSAFMLVDYYSPIVHMKVIRERSQALLKLINTEQAPPTPQCLKEFKGDIVSCFNAANLAKYLKTPFFIINSPYDQWSLNNILVVQCLQNKKAPYSLQSCNQTTIGAVKQFRKAMLDAFAQFKKDKQDVGFWAPACVQHGYSDQSSFTNPHYRVPDASGVMLYEAIAEFLNDPKNAKQHIDDVQWPNNKGCNGMSPSFLRSQ